MVAVAERYDATMYRTGGYKGSDRSQASSRKTHTPKKENTYLKTPTTSTPRNTSKGKAPAKKRTYTKSNKPSKAEMDLHKAEGACFYCGKSGHMANECPKKKLRPTMFASLRKPRPQRRRISAGYRQHRGARWQRLHQNLQDYSRHA